MSDFYDPDEKLMIGNSKMFECWLKQSLKNTFDDIEKSIKVDQETVSLFNSLHTFKDISKLKTSSNPASKKLFEWCGGQFLDQICDQDEQFYLSDVIHSVWINRFKTACINRIYSLWEKNKSPHSNFISALNHFLNLLDSQPERQQIFHDKFVKNYVENDSNDRRECIQSLVEFCDQYVSEAKSHDEFFEAVKSLNELAKPFITKTEDKLTTKLQSLLLPHVEIKMEDGRKIVVVKGNVIAISKIKPQIEKLVSKAEEIQIVGLVSIYVDCDLENDIWHGTNLTIVTDKLFVTDKKRILWDVSGCNKNQPLLGKAEDGQLPGEDGAAGEHGLPGESGGNVIIKCNEMFNAENWTIKSNGGRGNDGQDGGDGKTGENGQDATRRNPRKDEFKKIFNSMLSSLASTEPSIENIYKKFKMAKIDLITNSNDSSSKIFIDDCVVITISHLKQSILGKSHRLVLWKGEKGEDGQMGGRGGEGGRAGRGGRRGAILIHSDNSNVPGMEIINQTGKPGVDGKDGLDGKCGKKGKSTGDVGYIDNLNENWGKDNYLGFENDTQLDIKYVSEEELVNCRQNPYTKCTVNNEERYAVLERKEESKEIKIIVTKTTYGRQRQSLQVASRKKLTNQLGIVQYLAQIAERKCIIQSLTNIEDIVHQTVVDHQALIKFSSLYQRFQNDRRNNPEILYQRSIDSRFVLLDKSELNSELFDDVYTFNQLNTNQDEVAAMEKLDAKNVPKEITNVNEYLENYLQHLSHYLEAQKTEDDNDNILHTPFGHKDWTAGLYVCEDVDKLREQRPLDLTELRLILRKKNHDDFSQQNGIQLSNGHIDTEAQILTRQSNLKNKDIILMRKISPGVWKKIDCTLELLKFCYRRIRQIAKLRGGAKVTNDFISSPKPKTELSDWNAHKDIQVWLNGKTTENNKIVMNQIITSVEMFNPEYGCTPRELSSLILIKLKEQPQLDEQFAKDIGLLAERVFDYDNRKVDPVFYLTIVKNLNSSRWKYEFVLLDIEERLKLVFKKADRIYWRKLLYKLDDNILAVLQERLQAAGVPGSREIRPEILKRTLEIMADQVTWNKEDVISLSRLPLTDWLYDLKDKFWRKKVDELYETQKLQNENEEKEETVYLLLELENKKGITFYRNVIRQLKNPTADQVISQLKKYLYYDDNDTFENQSAPIERNHNEIISMIEQEKRGNTSHSIISLQRSLKIKERLAVIMKKLYWRYKVNQLFPNMPLEEEFKKEEAVYLLLQLDNQEGTIFCRNVIKQLLTADQFISQLKQHFRTNSYYNDQSSLGNQSVQKEISQNKQEFTLTKIQKEIEQFLYDYICAVQKLWGFKLHNNQRVAIYTLLMKENNTLVQVPTGEGKSLIAAALAIYYALYSKKKVDVITSNNVLAQRDSNQLNELYQHFNINVAHNCSEEEDDRIRAYKSPVIYGELSNFQRDYLLDEFYGRKIRSGRPFECIVIDEVDCMLLDRGNNMLYLTHDIPGMEMLESLYVFIWEKIRTTSDQLETIKSAVLFDLYGEITINDLVSILDPSMEKEHDRLALWSNLIKMEVINKQGRLLIENVEALKDKFNDQPELGPKLVFLFSKLLKRKRHIRIPQHLTSFVDRHLNTFIENAMRAMKLNADQDYVVDFARSGTNTNPQIIIIDRNTGTDQTISQWDGGLHQFLQLKEGCRLTLQGLKSVFVSNVTYIKRYDNLVGLTGTLGYQSERQFLKEMYKCDFFSVPTALPKRFVLKQTIIAKTENKWLEEIKKETKRIVKRNRSIVIFCQTIKLVKTVYELLKPIYKENIHCYKRDYQPFTLGPNNQLDTRQVIVATNLAGRGTDIKISHDLSQKGGLHICLTYLPESVRVEEQAMGRAGRQGNPGSSRLVLYEPEVSENGEWSKTKIFDMKLKRNRNELHRISRLWEDYTRRVEKQEMCFDIFREKFNDFNNRENKSIDDTISFNLLDKWALWVDHIDHGLTFESQSTNKLKQQLNNEIINQMRQNEWMTPARSIIFAQKLSTSKNKEHLAKAVLILDKLIKSNDNFLYPAAYYYRAFISMSENTTENENNLIISNLRATEAILKQNLGMQINFFRIINRLQTEGNQSRCLANGYKEQKANAVHLLSFYISSIQSLLGSRCSVSDLLETNIDVKNAEIFFNQLVKTKCIVKCRVNDHNAIPNRDLTLKKIANEYDVKQEDLEEFLKEVENLSEEEMKKKLENTDIIRCTRRKFWNLLVQRKALLLPTSDQLCKFDIKDPSLKFILFDPTPDNIKDLLSGKKSITDFEYAILQPKAILAKVDLTILGKLTNENDLIAADVTNQTDRKKIWEALKQQEILDNSGRLSQNYQLGKNLNYPDCPIYEGAVMNLIEKTYVAEFIRRQWLEERDPIRRMKLIGYLPLDPYGDLLWDLQAAHIISSNRVTEEKIDFDKIIAENVTSCPGDKQRILQILENHRAIYTISEWHNTLLHPIRNFIPEMDDDNTEEAIRTELNSFKLVGLTHVIQTSKKLWNKEKIQRYLGIAAIEMTKVGLKFVLSSSFGFWNSIFELINSVTIDSTKKRMKDIQLSTWKSPKNLSWADNRLHIFKDLKTSNENWTTDSRIYSSNKMNVEENVLVKLITESYYPSVSQSMALERLMAQIKHKVNGKLKILFCRLGAELDEKIKFVVNSNIKDDTLNQLYQSKGPNEAEWFVKDVLKQIIYDWVDDTQFWSSKTMKKVNWIFDEIIKNHQASSLADEFFKSVESVLDEYSWVDNLSEMTKLQIESLKMEMDNNLTATENNSNEPEASEFSKWALNHVTFKLIKENKKTMESLKQQISEKIGEVTCNYGVIWLKHREREEFKKSNQTRNKKLTDRIQQQPSHRIQACLKLMRKTKNPKLLTALIRENSVPDEDPFIQAGFQKALTEIQKKCPDLSLALIGSSQEAANLIETDPNIASYIIYGWNNYKHKI